MPKPLDNKCTYNTLKSSYGFETSETYPDLDLLREKGWIKASSDVTTAERVRATGWKFHLGIEGNITRQGERERSLELLAKTWDTAMPVIASSGGAEVKIIAPESKLESSRYEQGKQMTIYHDSRSSREPEDWYRMLARTEIALEAADIPPAEAGKTYKAEFDADRPIPGSRYFRYRSDCDRNGKTSQDVTTEAAIKRAKRTGNPKHCPYAFENGIKDPFEGLDYAKILQEERVKVAQQAVGDMPLDGLQGVEYQQDETQQDRDISSTSQQEVPPPTPGDNKKGKGGCVIL